MRARYEQMARRGVKESNACPSGVGAFGPDRTLRLISAVLRAFRRRSRGRVWQAGLLPALTRPQCCDADGIIDGGGDVDEEGELDASGLPIPLSWVFS